MILVVLIALVARVDAAPGGASIGLAMRHADARMAEPAGALDEDGDEEAEERAAERAEIDDGEEAEEAEEAEEIGDGQPASRGLVARNDEIADEADAPASLALGGDDTGAPASLAIGEDDAAVGSAGPGALAMLDAELAPGDATAGLDAVDAGAMAGAQEMYEQWMRHQRPSPWGRLDVGVSWRRRWSAPIVAPAHRHDEIWLVATWRR